MRSYSSKGRQADAVSPSFELDGVTFTGQGSISMLDLSEFARLAAAGFDSGSAEGIAIMADIYRSVLGDDEYRRFLKHCRDHGTDGRLLVEILGGLIAESSDRPTSRPSDSPDGPPPAPDSAKVVSFSRGTVEQVDPPKQEETEPQERRVVSYG